jgi:hypothetical protein
VSERRPWNRASRRTSLAENIDGIPEDDDLNFTMLGVALLELCGIGFHALDVAKDLGRLPAGRADLHRRARESRTSALNSHSEPQGPDQP